MTHAVTQAIVLAVVDVVVVNVVPIARGEENAAVREGGHNAVVHLKSGMFGHNAVRRRELVVILVPPAARPESPLVVIEISLRTGALDAKPGDAHVGPGGADDCGRVERVAGQEGALGTVVSTIPRQRDPLGDS